MIVTLKFNLPEERFEHECAIHGSDWRSIVCEVNMLLRNKLKYGHEYKTADEALEAVQTALWDECHETGLDPWSE
jgi:hypothetical protein